MTRTLLLLLFSGTILFMALRSLRAMRMQERYVLLFFVTGIPFLLLAAWPDGIVWLSQQLQIEKPTLMVLCLGIFTITLLSKLFSIVSVQRKQIATLAQMVGILNQKLGQSPSDRKLDKP